ncbi:mariner Mos1 transposase [Trichonephila clavipes]|nr:mariner Mos1 transposase [Trichonephila clavipes]
MDETLLHHFTPKSNRQSAERTALDEPTPKSGKTNKSAGKVMASVFWDTHGIIFIDYLKKGKPINSDYYVALLERLKDEIAEKWPHLKKKKVLFHQVNAQCHKSMKSMAKLHELSFELLPHPTYSPDLAPSDFFLFSDLKRMLAGQKFHADEDVITETKSYLRLKTNCIIKMVSKNCMAAIIVESSSKGSILRIIKSNSIKKVFFSMLAYEHFSPPCI